MKKQVSLWIITLILACGNAFSQQYALSPALYHAFDRDSLQGFDEDAAKEYCLTHQYTGKEYPIKMFYLKREFINNKYGLAKNPPVYQPAVVERSQVVPACTNEDFEASTAGTITVSNQIQGWTITNGQNDPPNSSCNLTGCCPMQPSNSAVHVTTNGYIDPVIGPCYPIFSVFGDGPPNTHTAATTNNTHIPFPMRGTNFIRINDWVLGDQSMARLSKTFSVTPSNALFQFAFIAVFYPGHNCCSAGAFNIRLLNASAGNTVITCPQFSASAPSGQCTNTNTSIQFLATAPASLACQPYNPNAYDPIFNKWQIVSMDLTTYIGQNITIELIASDCDAGGHYGYVYFDAQCQPMSILGNGVPYPAGSQSVTLPTCGPNGATICATPGLGPYSWAGPNIPPGYSTPSYTNQCFTTSISAQYTLFMNPPGGCAPFTRIVNTTVTPAPTLVGTIQQATCGDTIAVISVTPGGSAGNPAKLQWFPSPYQLNTQTTVAQYVIPHVGQPTMVVTISASDQVGCPVTLTMGVNPPAPVPEFTLVNTTGTSTLSCLTPTIGLFVNTTYTYGPKAYFWASPSMTSSEQSITVTSAANYTVTLYDPVSGCARTQTIAIGVNSVMPVAGLTNTFQNITCTTGVNYVVATAISPTVNFSHLFLSPLGGSFVSQSYTAAYLPGTPGTYTYQLLNVTNGCRTTRTFSVVSNEGFPVFDLLSPQNFTLGCNSKTFAVIQIANAQAVPGSGGAVSYSLLLPGSNTATPSGTLSTISVYTVVNPGSYTVVTKNNANGCETRIPISIISNTIPPSIDTILVPTYVLTCFQPSMTVTGVSFTKNVETKWYMPSNQELTGSDLPVETDPTKPNSPTLATFTFQVQDKSSTCISRQSITIQQNLFPPLARITTQGSLTCVSVSLQLTNSSDYGPGNPFPHPKIISGLLWQGPSPQVPKSGSSTYEGYYSGTYTMTARDENNGCTSHTTIEVKEDREYPLLTPTIVPMPCGAETRTLGVDISTPKNDLAYKWTAPPGVPVSPSNTAAVIAVPQEGVYGVQVLDTKNGCMSETTNSVTVDSLTAAIEPDKNQGYAPLTVTFHNLSTTQTGTNNIEAVWVFGNSKTATLSTVSSTNTTYTQPGTYTVTLFARKGECLDKTQEIIVVDIPSQMVIPNVFTPNNDGVNDLYFLQRASNLARISAVIYDRWGNKVYEVTSETGQLEWDGQTQYGKPAPSGTYFYIITAEGKDGKTYDEKGSLSLIR